MSKYTVKGTEDGEDNVKHEKGGLRGGGGGG